jgi:pimeloyl-ACP methyl ester carboxylesterase
MQIETRVRPVACDDSGGAGIPLVLIHGFPLDRTIWSAQVRGLADVARVITPDLRGFGESPLQRSATATTMDDYAADVAGLLDALDVEDAVIGGVSMGGYVAMAFHRAYPRRVRGLVLVDTRGGPDSEEARESRDQAAALARARGTAAVAAQMLEKMLTRANAHANEGMRLALSELMGAQPVEGVVAALSAIRDRPDSRPAKARITVPTLVVCGAEDELIPPSESEALRDAIRWARLVLIPGAAHLPNYEQPEAFNRAVREFLAIFS